MRLGLYSHNRQMQRCGHQPMSRHAWPDSYRWTSFEQVPVVLAGKQTATNCNRAKRREVAAGVPTCRLREAWPESSISRSRAESARAFGCAAHRHLPRARTPARASAERCARRSAASAALSTSTARGTSHHTPRRSCTSPSRVASSSPTWPRYLHHHATSKMLCVSL